MESTRQDFFDDHFDANDNNDDEGDDAIDNDNNDVDGSNDDIVFFLHLIMMAMSMMIMNMITIILSDKNYFDDSDDNSKIHQATVDDNLVDGRRVKQVVYIGLL